MKKKEKQRLKALQKGIKKYGIPREIYVDNGEQIQRYCASRKDMLRAMREERRIQKAAAEAARAKFLEKLPGEVYTPTQIEMVLDWMSESQKRELLKELLIGDGNGIGF